MKRLAAMTVIIFTLLSSCDMFMPESIQDRTTYLVAIGLDYMQNPRITHLENTRNDFRGIIEQFETLQEMAGTEYEVTTFSDYASESGRIRFGFDHVDGNCPGRPIFDGRTGEMRTPRIIDLEGYDRTKLLEMFMDELVREFESTSVPDENDLIILYFTGHGTEDGGPVIYHSEDPGLPYMDITYEEMEEMFLSRYDARSVSIIDCCYSGRAVRNSELGSTISFNEGKDSRGNRDDRKSESSFTSALANGMEKSFDSGNPIPQHSFITACSDGQKSYEYDMYQNSWNSDRYGAFTLQVLECWGYDTENMEPAFPAYLKGTCLTLADMYSSIAEGMSPMNRKRSTPDITRSRYDIMLFDFRK